MSQESRLIISIDARNAQNTARELSRELQNITNSGSSADRQVGVLGGSLRNLAGYMAGIVSVGAAINKMDAYTGLQNRLKLVTDSQSELNTAMGDTFKIAQNTASSWDSVAMVYQRFADNADRLNITMAQTAALTETVSKAISVSGGSAASAEAALMQFGQALASGVLRGEEFNSIAEQAPGLLKAIAFGLNTNVGSLRAMAAEGKITGDVLVEALSKAQPYIDDLFNKTDFTIAQSFTKLSNEITKFVGEAGSGSGAAKALSESISGLANNLSTIADIAVVGGVALLTKAILTQTVAIYGSITASVARRSTLLAELAVQAAASTAEVARTGAIAQFTAMQLVDAKATAARMTGIQRLAYVQATVIPLEAKATQAVAAHTATTAADTVVQELNNKARTRGAMLLAAVGGPIGAITIGVAALAGGYMLMRDNADKATASIEYQGQKVDELVVKYRELNTLQRDNETKALAEQVQDLAVKFRVASSDLTSFIQALPASDEKIQFFEKLTKEYQNGKISSDAYYKSVKEVNFLTDEQLNKVRGLVGQYGEAKTKFGEAETAQKALAESTRKTTEDVKEQAIGVAKLTEKMKELLRAANQNIQDSGITTALASRGYDDTMIDLAKKYLAIEGAIVKNAQGQSMLREDLQKSLTAEYQAIIKAKNAVDARNKSEKDRTKELEKQQQVLKLNSKVLANAAKYNFGGLESQYGLPKGLLAGIQMQESRGDTYRGGKLLTSPAGAQGSFQFMPATAKRFNVNVEDMASSAEGAAKYLNKLLKMFNGDIDKTIMAYNAGEGNVQSGKAYGFKETQDYLKKVKGYTAGSIGIASSEVSSKEFDRILEESIKLYEQQAKARESIEIDVADKVKRINLELQQKKEEIEKANFSPERKKEIIAEYESRAASDIAIANQALKTKLDEYAAFTKSEETLLRESFDQKKFYASQDIELSKDQKSKASELLEKQYQEELSLIKLAKEQRIFAAQESMMTEMEAVRNRYDLERKEIANIRDEKERSAIQEAKDKAYINLGVATGGSMLSSVQGRSSGFGMSQTDTLNAEYVKQNEEMNLRYAQQQEAAQNNAMALLAIEQEYLLAKGRLNTEYDEKLVISREIDHENQLQYYGNMLAITQSTFGQMTGLVKDSQGENSSAYKTMFAMQQAMAIASALVSTHLAAAQVMADPTALTLAQKTTYSSLILAAGYANAGMIAAQTIAGFKTGGYTGNLGTSDVAGVVHGQEYVLNAAATKRVGTGTLDAINSGGSLGGEISVNIQNYGTSKQFDVQQIDANTVRIIARDEARTAITSDLQNPNSAVSKGIKNNFNTSNRRG